MNKARSMDGFKPCPKCLSDIDVVVVRQNERQNLQSSAENYFFVNCHSCGEGTSQAFGSMEKLQFEWNQKVEETVSNII